MRCLALFLPRLPTDRILRERARADDGAPFALFAEGKGGERLTAVDARAERAGLAPGMAVADARAMRPALRLAAADPAADAALLARSPIGAGASPRSPRPIRRTASSWM